MIIELMKLSWQILTGWTSCSTLSHSLIPAVQDNFSRHLKALIFLSPGFERNNVFLSSGNSSVFWVQYENNAENTLIFQLLIISASHKSKTCPFSRLCQWKHKKLWEAWPQQVTPTGQRDISYHRTSCSVCTWLWESPRRGADCSLGMGLASVSEWWTIEMWITCFYWLLSLSLFLNLSLISIFIIFYFVSVVLLFSSQPMSFTFFSPDSPSATIHWGEGEVG